MQSISNKLKSLPRHIWILSVIILLGIFLRAYNFHAWLDFGSDQVKDAIVVGATVEGKAPWPAYGPDMGNSGAGGRENRFKVGPIYYDAEIISAKIFGNNPVSMAYPDLLFGILSIPLFYFFLRKIFEINLALLLTGLYSISFYALTFSHSAWNVNSIPFFSLLFLLSLYELVLHKEETSWGWIVALGSSLGIGFQLHAILLVLFPAVLFFSSALFLRKNPRVWKKMLVVIIIMLVFNLGQIIAEGQNNFKNSKIFLSSAAGSSTKSSDSLLVRTANNLSCNFQSNAYMLTAVGNGDCDFSLAQYLSGQGSKQDKKKVLQSHFIAKAVACLFFSILGYGLLLKKWRKTKKQEEKIFFGLIMIFTALSFIVMFPVLDSALRYFVHIFFLPFIFLGLSLEFLAQKFTKKYVAIAACVVLFLVATNFLALYAEVKDEFVQSRIILGQVEKMVDHMISQSGSQKEIYLSTNSSQGDFFKSLNYVAAQKGVDLRRIGDLEIASPDKNEFYLGNESDTRGGKINGHSFDNYQIFNQTYIFHFIK